LRGAVSIHQSKGIKKEMQEKKTQKAEEDFIGYIKEEAEKERLPVDQTPWILPEKRLSNIPEMVLRRFFRVLHDEQIIEGKDYSTEFALIFDPWSWPGMPQDGDDYPDEWIEHHKPSSGPRAEIALKILKNQFGRTQYWETFVSFARFYYDEIENRYIRWVNS
jgi:hypothetical protein